MVAIAAGADTDALRALVLTAAAQRFLRYQPNLGAYGGFPTGSSPLRLVLLPTSPCGTLMLGFGGTEALHPEASCTPERCSAGIIAACRGQDLSMTRLKHN